MIPLERWLRDQTGASQPDAAFMTPAMPMSGDVLEEPNSATNWGRDLEAGHENRIRVLEDALQVAEAALTRMREDHEAREREISERLGAEAIEKLSGLFQHAINAFSRRLEETLADALQPFLSEEIRKRSTGALLDMVQTSIRETTSSLLEIRAPGYLHGLLQSTLDRMDLPVIILDSQEIEMRFDTHVDRFDDLSAEWISIIRGENHE